MQQCRGLTLRRLDVDFTANQMCCDCGGGFRWDRPPNQEWDASSPYCYDDTGNGQLNSYGGTCATISYNGHFVCGIHDDSEPSKVGVDNEGEPTIAGLRQSFTASIYGREGIHMAWYRGTLSRSQRILIGAAVRLHFTSSEALCVAACQIQAGPRRG